MSSVDSARRVEINLERLLQNAERMIAQDLLRNANDRGLLDIYAKSLHKMLADLQKNPKGPPVDRVVEIEQRISRVETALEQAGVGRGSVADTSHGSPAVSQSSTRAKPERLADQTLSKLRRQLLESPSTALRAGQTLSADEEESSTSTQTVQRVNSPYGKYRVNVDKKRVVEGAASRAESSSVAVSAQSGRAGMTGTLSQSELERLIKRDDEDHASIAEELSSMASELKKQQVSAERRIKQDIRMLDSVDDATERSRVRVARVTEKIVKHTERSRSGLCGTCLVLSVVLMVFVFMFLFMKLFPKRS